MVEKKNNHKPFQPQRGDLLVEKKLSKGFFFHPSPSGEGVERSETDEAKEFFLTRKANHYNNHQPVDKFIVTLLEILLFSFSF